MDRGRGRAGRGSGERCHSPAIATVEQTEIELAAVDRWYTYAKISADSVREHQTFRVRNQNLLR